MSSITDDVARLFAILTRRYGSCFPLSAVVELLMRKRSKPIRFDIDTMPTGISGYCIGLYDTDLICTRIGLDAVNLFAAQCHEIGHLLLGHVPLLSAGEATVSYAVFITQRNLQHAVYRSHETAYGTARECNAEALGTLLKEAHEAHQRSVPQTAQDWWT